MKKTICVTGATGFVGQGVIPMLLDAGYQVRILVRSEQSLTKLNFIPQQQKAALTTVFGDPCNSDDIVRALDGSDVLLHLVGIRRHEIKRTGKTYRDIDVGSAIAAREALKQTGKKRIILLSAANIGNSQYVRCKAEAEAAVVQAGLDCTIFRPSFITAPGQQWPIIMSPVLWFSGLLPGHFGDVARRAGNITRRQLANGFINAIQDDSTIGKVFDVPGIRTLGN